MRSTRLVIAGLLLAVLVGSSLLRSSVAPVTGATGVQLGVNAHAGDPLPGSGSQIRMSRIWDQNLTWGQLQPTGPWFDDAAYGRLKTVALDAVAKGMRPLLVFWGTPVWAAGTGCAPDAMYQHLSCPLPPMDTRHWESFVYDVAYEFTDPKYEVSGEGPAFEVWNEPDDPRYWRGTDSQLLALSRLAHQRVKAAAKDRAADTGAATAAGTVVCCGWARTGAAAMRRWLKLGGGTYADAVSYHPYPDLSPAAPTDGGNAATITARFADITDKPLWATEVGANNCARNPDIPGPCINYTVQQQVDVIQSTIHALKSEHVDRVVWYPWLDSGPVSETDPMLQRLGLQPVLDAVVNGVPTAPSGLALRRSSAATVSLAWNPAGDGAADGDPDTPHGVTSYNVHRAITPEFVPTTANTIATVTGTAYADPADVAGSTYYYKVTAQDAQGHVGRPSNEVAARLARH